MAVPTRRLCWSLFVGLAFFIPVLGQSNLIVNQGERVTSQRGQTVILTCMVNDPLNRPVQWWFVDHNLQLSNNEDILLSSNHYSIERPQGGDHPQWNLRISSLLAGDAGVFQCRIQGTTANITSTLRIAETPRPFNFTDCCVAEGVSASCLPICFPSQVDLLTFNPLNCANDFLKLLKCGTDGRNHVPCCRQRLVASQCLGFCANQPPATLDISHTACIGSAEDIIQCYEEGQNLLPSTPLSVTVSVLTPTTLYVKWSPPKEGNVTGYKVYHKKSSQGEYKGSNPVTGVQYQLSGLEPGTLYEVYVMAVNSHGTSLPSDRFRISTPPIAPPVPTPNAAEFTDCCRRQGVSPLCQRLLCTGQNFQTSGQDVSVCIAEVDKVFICIAGERNHSACCASRSIPPLCYPLCEGTLTKPNFRTMECYTSHMRDIVDCFNEGQSILPGPPINLALGEVSDTSAFVSWDPPATRGDLAQQYVVLYKERSKTSYTQIMTSDLNVRLTGLTESTEYELKVSAINDKGSSLPTPTIIFITYYLNGDIIPSMPPPVTPGLPPTVDQCCVTEGIQPQCRPLCNITASFNQVDLLAITCEKDLGRIFMCVGGGSDHSACCARRGVPEMCLKFCSFDRESVNSFTFDYAHFACVAFSYFIGQCIDEGYASHPTWPEDVFIHNYTSRAIRLSWQRPTRVPSNSNLTYIVRYRLDTTQPIDQMPDWTEVVLPSSRLSYIIQSLQPDQRYAVQVLASSGEARSLASSTLRVQLLPEKSEPPLLLPNINFTAPADVSACCIKEGVSADCMAGCTGETTNVEGNCARQLDKILRCSADNKDHRPCCQRSNVPQQCLTFCMGDGKINHLVSMLCLGFSQQIVTCFHEGYDKLPSWPQDFRVSNIRSTYITFTWTPPVGASGNITYDLFYSHSEQPAVKVNDISSPYNLTGLKPFTLYNVYILAENQYGVSRPTPRLDLYTLAEKLPDLHVWQIPEGTIQEQSSVSLQCLTDGGPDVYIYWITNTGVEIHDSYLDIDRVNRSNTGRYTCIADSGQDKRVSKDIYLHVQFAPDAMVRQPRVYVHPNRGLTASLSCDFVGFPDHIKWLKDGKEITPAYRDANRFQKTIITFQEKGLMVAKLEIEAVEPRDYGTYYCRGQSKLGHDEKSIQLLNPDPKAPIPPLVGAPAVPNVTACCIDKGVSADCLPACSFDIDLKQIEKLDNEAECLASGDLGRIVQCGADGKNHTKCCMDAAIPEFCLPFCAGQLPEEELGDEYYECLSLIEEIVDCMEEGHRLIPGVPRNVKGKLTSEGYIEVEWDSPLNNPKAVQQYHILYKAQLTEQQVDHVPVGINKYVLSGVHSNTEYDIYLQSHNHYGSSANSNHVRITTHQFNPSAPQNLRGYVVNGVNIRLNWDAPSNHPGGVTHYRIYYRQVKKKDWIDESTKFVKTTYRIDKLKPNTQYEIYVKAISSTHASDRSNVIVIKTKDAAPTTLAKRGQATGNSQVGIGIGVAFAILALIIAATIVAFLYFRTRRTREANYKESVSFENPGYATASEARVTGLPSFDTKPPVGGVEGGGVNGQAAVMNGQDIEPSIMRETIDGQSDQGYSTLSPATNTNPDTATLHVSKPTTLNHTQIELEESPRQ